MGQSGMSDHDSIKIIGKTTVFIAAVAGKYPRGSVWRPGRHANATRMPGTVDHDKAGVQFLD